MDFRSPSIFRYHLLVAGAGAKVLLSRQTFCTNGRFGRLHPSKRFRIVGHLSFVPGGDDDFGLLFGHHLRSFGLNLLLRRLAGFGLCFQLVPGDFISLPPLAVRVAGLRWRAGGPSRVDGSLRNGGLGSEGACALDPLLSAAGRRWRYGWLLLQLSDVFFEPLLLLLQLLLCLLLLLRISLPQLLPHVCAFRAADGGSGRCRPLRSWRDRGSLGPHDGRRVHLAGAIPVGHEDVASVRRRWGRQRFVKHRWGLQRLVGSVVLANNLLSRPRDRGHPLLFFLRGKATLGDGRGRGVGVEHAVGGLGQPGRPTLCGGRNVEGGDRRELGDRHALSSPRRRVAPTSGAGRGCGWTRRWRCRYPDTDGGLRRLCFGIVVARLLELVETFQIWEIMQTRDANQKYFYLFANIM